MTATDTISDETVSASSISEEVETPAGVALTSLLPGDRGVLCGHDLQPDESELLRALGLARRAPFRLCKAGSPWILQVRGTRIGLDDAVARRLTVTRTP